MPLIFSLTSQVAQCVMQAKARSSLLNFHCGVKQSSALGHLLIMFGVSDLILFFFFVDDTVRLYTLKRPPALQNVLLYLRT